MAFAVAVMGLNIVTGLSGQVSLGHSAFMGTGAFTTAVLVADHNWSFFATVPIAALICFAVGIVVGVPALRLKGLYLALATLGLSIIFPKVVEKYNFTGGSNGKRLGRKRLVPPAWTHLDRQSDRPIWIYFVILSFTVVLFVQPAGPRVDRAARQSGWRGSERGQPRAVQGARVRSERGVRGHRRVAVDVQQRHRIGIELLTQPIDRAHHRVGAGWLGDDRGSGDRRRHRGLVAEAHRGPHSWGRSAGPRMVDDRLRRRPDRHHVRVSRRHRQPDAHDSVEVRRHPASDTAAPQSSARGARR